LRVKPVGQQCGMPPEHLIDDVVPIQVERGDGDRVFGFAPAQGVRAECDDVTDGDGFLTELAEQECRAVTDEDEFHAVVGDGVDGLVEGSCARDDRSETGPPWGWLLSCDARGLCGTVTRYRIVAGVSRRGSGSVRASTQTSAAGP